MTAQPVLLQSQANEVLEAIQKAGFDPANFEWGDRGNQETILTHRPSGYYYIFRVGLSHSCVFSPSQETPRVGRYPDNWRNQIRLVKEWLGYLQREVEAPDLWAAVQKERALVNAAVGSEADVADFTSSELEYVRKQLVELKDYVLETQRMGSEQSDFIAKRFDYLSEAAGRQTKTDWLHTFAGVLLSVVLSLALSSATAQDLFRAAGELFQHVLSSSSLSALP